jgi:acetylornithine deacetylase/succinyl-diaminopimelate desuccinylase-like protein
MHEKASKRINETARYLEENFPNYLEDLKTLVRIPSVSFEGFPESELQRSAEAVAALLRFRGLENVRILRIPGAHPYVYGERMRAPGKPTLLLYAHHDVQPPGRVELWDTSPFEPVEKPGPGGDRLYGRGSADDKAGVIVHTSAIDSYLHTVGELPVNVKVVIEGEEETGSSHLSQFLQAFRDELSADILVLTDTGNFDCGIPALTVALRGMVGVEVEVKSLSKTVHSGMWGGPLPDPAMALSKILATLVDDQGQIAIPGVLDKVQPIGPEEEAELAKIPYNETEFRAQSGMLSGTQFLKSPSPVSPLVQLWRLPSLTVNAIQASSKLQAGNIINDSAWAKVTIRLVADMDPKEILHLLKQHLEAQVPWGLEIHVKTEACSGPWSTDAKGVAFEAAEKALERGYGKAPFKIGAGGSIPFVKPFADELGGAPALLIGVEDPYTNAHGENESVLLGDLRSACLSQIYLFAELAQSWRKDGENQQEREEK